MLLFHMTWISFGTKLWSSEMNLFMLESWFYEMSSFVLNSWFYLLLVIVYGSSLIIIILHIKQYIAASQPRPRPAMARRRRRTCPGSPGGKDDVVATARTSAHSEKLRQRFSNFIAATLPEAARRTRGLLGCEWSITKLSCTASDAAISSA